MGRVLLLLPTRAYRAEDFLDAARRVGAEVVVGSDQPQALADLMGDRAIQLSYRDAEAAVERIGEIARDRPLDAIVPVDDSGVLIAALAGARLGLRHNPPEAAAASVDKAAMRRAFDGAGVPQPAFRLAHPKDDVRALAGEIGFPVVVKPVSLSAGRGVIRADTAEEAATAAARIRAILAEEDDPEGPLLLERYAPGAEVAVEGLLRRGDLEVLAIFDKPDPLEGPFFEETIYVTPSRFPTETLSAVERLTAGAAAALGLREGAVHAELRIDAGRLKVLELASRSIGGLCARSLRFGAGISLEELILRHALGLPTHGLHREKSASGVMMIPIPRAGVLEKVGGVDEASSVPGVEGIVITIPRRHRVVPLPEGDRYLGFLFARGEGPEAVERALRSAHARLEISIRDEGARADGT